MLFSELLFEPEEKFGDTARTLLSGLLTRDPLKRLGSDPDFEKNSNKSNNSNSSNNNKQPKCVDDVPGDILKADFFRKVDWDHVYARKSKGPWCPGGDNKGKHDNKHDNKGGNRTQTPGKDSKDSHRDRDKVDKGAKYKDKVKDKDKDKGKKEKKEYVPRDKDPSRTVSVDTVSAVK